MRTVLTAAMILFASMASAATDNNDPLELTIKLVVITQDGQSMTERTLSNMELFPKAKVGVTHLHQGENFNLIYVSPSDDTSLESPKYDIKFTFIENVFTGENEFTEHLSIGEPHNLLIPLTKDSDIVEYSFDSVSIGSQSKHKKSKNGQDTSLVVDLN